jgi:putative tricarboxylic transport membrane protein
MSPIVIGIILGPMVETNLRRALIMSDGDFSVFLTRPICATFLAIAIITLLLPVVGPKFGAWRRARKAMSATGAEGSTVD